MDQIPDSHTESGPMFAAEYETEYSKSEHARSGFRKMMARDQQYQEEKVPKSEKSDPSGL